MYRRTICSALASLPLVSAWSCTELLNPEGVGEAIHVERLRAEPYSFTYASGLTDSARVVVRAPDAWEQLWEQIWDRHSPLPELPEVDFSRNVIIVAALGTRSTGGYSIFVDSAYQRIDHIEVVVRKVSPGPRCGVATALTEPVDIARIPGVPQRVLFRERNSVHHCE